MKKIMLLAGAIAVIFVGCGKSHTDSVLEPAPVMLCQPGGVLAPATISVPPDEVESYLSQGYQIAPCASDPKDGGGGTGDDDDDGGVGNPAGDDDDDGGVGNPAGDDDDDDDSPNP